VLYYVHNDHLGRPEVITDQAKAKKWSAANYAYDHAVVISSSQIPSFNIGFPGQYFDAESGLWYNHHRYYDAATGRYITSDPIGLAGGLNTYAYVSNRPVLAVDQLGLSEADVSAAWKWLGGAYPQLTRGVSVSGSRILDYTGASGLAPGGGTVYIRQSYYDDNLTSWQLYEMTYTLIHESLHEYVFNEVGWLYALRHGGDDELHGWIRDKAADIMLEHEEVKEGKTDLSNSAGCIK
jgi:RHS repeat-associated protein